MTASTNYFSSLNEIGQLINQLFINGVINEDYARNAMVAQHVNDLKNNSIRFNSEGSVKANNPSISRKSNKQKKNKKLPTIDAKIIEEYIKEHPQIYNEIIENYLKYNLKIDFKPVSRSADRFNSSQAYRLALFNGKNLISESALALNI